MDYERKLPAGYTTTQILLHWAIVVLVLFQILFGESIEHAAEALRDGVAADAATVFWADAHIYAGVSVLLLTVVRLVARLGYGAPPPPAGTGRVQAMVANAVHLVFYLMLFGVPVSGLVAWYVAPEVGEIHALAKPAFLALIILHVLASLYHQFVVKDGVLMRMFVPRG